MTRLNFKAIHPSTVWLVLTLLACCLGNQVAGVDEPSLLPTGSLIKARHSHTATLLTNGQVLVAGGYTQDSTISGTCEVFDPARGTWRAATGMIEPRLKGYTATLLPSGKVLVVGGEIPGAAVDTCEIYDPAANTWTLVAGTLATPRQQHTATLLPSGKVLVTGGFSDYFSQMILASSEIFDPATGIWTSTAEAMAHPRYGHSATLLATGKVLVAGGRENYTGALDSSELFDPETGTWSNSGGLFGGSLYAHSATLLPSGLVILAGGLGGGGELSTSIIYDPQTGLWSPTSGALAAPRYNHAANLLPDGRVLVSGGPPTISEVFDPIAGTWSTLAVNDLTLYYGRSATLLPSGAVLIAGGRSTITHAESYILHPGGSTWSVTGNMAEVRLGHQLALLHSGDVLVAGGINSTDYLATCERFSPSTGLWSVTGSMSQARFKPVLALLHSGKILVVGGGDSDAATCEVYNPSGGTWSPTGALNRARTGHAATVLPNGCVLVVGGVGAGDRTCEVYDPALGTWNFTGSTQAYCFGHRATRLVSGKVLISGGAYATQSELYDPTTGTWSTSGLLAAIRYSHTATLLPSGQVLVAGGENPSGRLSTAEIYDPATGMWSATAGTMLTRGNRLDATLLPSGRVLVSGGEAVVTSEMYDPQTGAWLPAAAMSGRYGHAAVLLPSGAVLVCGGDQLLGVTTRSATAEILVANQTSADRPLISIWPTSILLGTDGISLQGTLFTGRSEGSSGTTGSSAAQAPLVQLMSAADGHQAWMPLSALSSFGATAAATAIIDAFPPGPAWVRVVANGIHGPARPLTVVGRAQTITFALTGTETYGTNVTLTGSASSGLAVSYRVVSGPGTVSGNTLQITAGSGTVVVEAKQYGDSAYAPATPVQSSLMASPATLIVRAVDRSMVQGAIVPSLVYDFVGLVLGDTAAVVSGTPILECPATSTSPVGDYPITITIVGMTASNYQLTQLNGTLSVIAAGSGAGGGSGGGGGGGCGMGSAVAFVLAMLCYALGVLFRWPTIGRAAAASPPPA